MIPHRLRDRIRRGRTGLRRRSPIKHRLGIESLEDRLVPALYTVTTLADDNNGLGVGGVSLREALGTGDADTIDFAVTGTINLNSALPNLSGSLRVLGPGAGNLTVRRDAAVQFRIFNVVAGANVEIAGLTIQNGDTNFGGGGVASVDAKLTLTDCVLENNRANGNGGAVYFIGKDANTLTISGCIVQDNTGETNVGGVSVGGNAASLASGVVSATVRDSAFLRNNVASGGPVGGLGLFGGPGSTFTVINTTFADNVSRLGSAGGLNISTSSPSTITVTGCTFLRNRGIHGGGMRVDGTANLTISDCIFQDNIQTGAGNGGGLTVQMSVTGSIEVTRSQFLGNSSSAFGGGMAATGGPTIFVTDSTFAANTAATDGGGLYHPQAVSILRSTFHSNAAGRDGGGLYAPGHLTLPSTITNSTFSNNSAGEDGGGLFAFRNYTITHTTVTANRADSDGNGLGGGGGIQSGGSNLLHHTLIAGNYKGLGSVRSDVGGALHAAGTYNLIGDRTGLGIGPIHGVGGNQIGSAASPINPMLGPLANNGGLTLTHALLPGSPALDAGNNAIVTVATDQRGFARIADSPDTGSTATVDIGAYEFVSPPNRPPVANADVSTTNEDEAVGIAVLANDSDPDGDPLTITDVSDPLHGTALILGQGIVTYRGDLNFFGTDWFSYSISDGQGHSASATVAVTINAVNDPPVAVDDSYTMQEDMIFGVVAPGVLFNDSDADGDSLSAILVSNPLHGTLTPNADGSLLGADGSFFYTPNPNFNGTDSFTYRASDGLADSNVVSVTITVLAINDVPNFIKGTDQTVTEDAGAQTVAGWASGISPGPADEAGQMIEFQVTNDNAALFAVPPAVATNGALAFTPALNANGSATVTVRLRDNGGTANGGQDTSAPQTFTITVTPVNDAPVAVDDTATTDEDTAVNIAVLANDSPGPASAIDEATQTLSVVALNSVPAVVGTPIATGHGSVVLGADGTVTYTPAADFNGPDSFTYTVRDSGTPPEQASAGGLVLINAVNDMPVAADGNVTTTEDADPGVTINLGDFVSDVETADANLTYTIVSSPAASQGTLTATASSGVLLYRPALNFNGDASFTYNVIDRGDPDNCGAAGPDCAPPLTSATRTITVHVLPVNDAPGADDESFEIDEDTELAVSAPGVLAGDSDVDSGLLFAQLAAAPAHGSLSLNPDGSFTYRPAADYFGPDVFTYRASDGSLESNLATVAITVRAVNDLPTASDDSFTVAEDSTGNSLVVLANDTDVDGDTLIVSAVTQGADGAVVLNADGNVTYTPDANFCGSDAFTYTASDGNGGTDTATVSVSVTCINDAPVANDDLAATDEDTAKTIAVLANDSDVDGDTLVVSAVTQGANGTVTINADGSVTYTPNANFCGSDAFTYTASDGNGGTDTATVSVSVNCINDAPVANDDLAATDEDTPKTIAVLANDTGAPNPLRIDSMTNGSKGTTSIDTKGTTDTTDDEIVYMPNAGQTGADSFTYTISDGGGGTATATVNVAIRNLVDLSGRVFDDLDNDGVYEPGNGDSGLSGVTVQLFNQTSGELIATRTTAGDGTYNFDVNLGAGTYRILETQPTAFLDGKETAGSIGGTVDNTQDSDQIRDIIVGAPGSTADAVDYLLADIRPSQALGLVWEDFNNDGDVNFGELAIPGVTVTLTGTDDRGNAVSRGVTTDSDGEYTFIDLRPTSGAGYTISEVHAAGFVDGVESLGVVNGTATGSAAVNDTFSGLVLPRPDSTAENYNFGERPASQGQVGAGQTATIGFWQNNNGQALIRSLNGGPTSTQLGNWLAETFPNMYGPGAGATNLTGKTNADVAAIYTTLFQRTKKNAAGGGPPKMDAQVMGTALATYVTNQTLAGTTATAYGFVVTQNGLGTRTFNVGSNSVAFGVANNSSVTVLDLLLAVNARSRNGLLYDLDGDGDATDALEISRRTMANTVFSAINEAGDL